MRIALLVLSGDAGVARERLRELYTGCDIQEFPRSAVEGGMLSRLSKLRRTGAEVFAVMTECLAWQYGQEALMLFGALGGARESIILDARGGIRRKPRGELIVSAPLAIAGSYRRGRRAVSDASKRMRELEREIVHPDFRSVSPAGSHNVKIAYLRATPAAGTQPGGATSHINGVVNGLLDLGAKIDLISNDEIAGLDENKVEFHIVPPDPRVMPRSAFDIYNGMQFSDAAARLVAEAPPDLIYQRYARFSWAGVEASHRARVPLCLEYNGSEVWIGKHWDRTEKLDLLERCERLNLKAAAKIFVISEVEKNNLLAAGVDDEKIVVNPNGVDADEFRPGIGGETERRELGISDETVLVGFVGSFGPWHGVLTLAEVIAHTPRESNIHFLLIGDGSLRGEVATILRESGDLGRVTFTGVVKHERVPSLLDACDILVSPHVPLADGSEFFGSPTKLFEYMAMGKAIVASDLAQIGDVLDDGVTALLVEPGNAAQLSEAIQRLGSDAGLRSRLGAAARQAAVDRHTWRRNAARVLEAFRQ